MPNKITASPLDQVRGFHALNRVWRPHLSTAERDIVGYVLDNSLCWQRDAMRASLTDMVEGTARVTASGHSRAALVRGLTKLRQLGVLNISPGDGASLLSINLEWKPAAMTTQETGGVRQPKRMRGNPEAEGRTITMGNLIDPEMEAAMAEEAPGCAQIEHGGVLRLSTGCAQIEHAPIIDIREGLKEQGKGSVGPSADAPGTLAGQAAAAPQTTPAQTTPLAVQPPLPLVVIRQRQRPARLPAPVHATVTAPLAPVEAPPRPVAAPPRPAVPPTPPAALQPPPVSASAAQRIEAVKARQAAKVEGKVTVPWVAWRDAWRATFPDTAPVLLEDARTNAQMNLLRQGLVASKVDWQAFITWSVCNWRAVIAKEFGWMKDKPAFPRVSFLLRWKDRFMDMYADAATKAAFDFAPGEQGEYQRMRLAGMSHDAANIEIGIRRAASQRSGQGDRSEVNRVYRELEAGRKKLRAVENARLAAERLANPPPVVDKPTVIITNDTWQNGVFELPDMSTIAEEE